jgi:hypothetical protein
VKKCENCAAGILMPESMKVNHPTSVAGMTIGGIGTFDDVVESACLGVTQRI